MGKLSIGNLAIQLKTPLLLRKPCELFASVARVCQRQLGFLVYFLRQATSERPRPIVVKLWHMIANSQSGCALGPIMQVQKFGGPPPKKLGAQNMQNSARFQKTFEFDRDYLRNGSRYPKSENVMIESDSSRVLQKCPVNFGELTTE